MERELLERLSRLLDQDRRYEDAGMAPLVVNIDAVGKNDRRPRLGIEYLAKKAVIAASSDVVAKSARPMRYAIYVSHEDPETVYKLASAAKQTISRLGGYAIAGDADSESLRIAVAAIGVSYRFVPRSGARPGEKVYLLGPIGHGGALSYALRLRLEPPKEALRLMEYEYFDPNRHAIVQRASAAMDVSDGLAVTLRDIAEASNVRIEVDYEALRRLVDPGIRSRSEERGIDPADLALYGGDEYVIVYVSDEPLGGERIGEVLEGSGVNAERRGRTHR